MRPPLATAPSASPSSPGTPSLRTTKTSSGTPSAFCDLVPDRHTPAWQHEHDHVVAAGVIAQPVREQAPRLGSIAKALPLHRCAPPLRLESTRAEAGAGY